MPTIINRNSRKVVNQILSAILGVSMLVWLGGFAVVTPKAEAQSTADIIASLQAQIAALTAQLATLSGSQSSAPAGMLTKNLSQGMRDSQVSILQGWLKTLPGVYPEGIVSGYFGSLTRAAVVRYQASKGIAQVGLVGPQTRGALNAQFSGGVVVTPGTPPVSGSQVGVSLAPTTPASGVAPKGSTGVKMTSVNFTAPVSGQVVITDVVVHRGGVGAATDFSQVYLYDGSSRLTSGRTVNSSTNNSEFHNLAIVVAPGQTKTIDIVADMATGAAAGNVNYFELVAASSVGSTAAVVGTFPIRGNNFSVAGATAGTITIADMVPSVSPKVGEQQVKVAAFSLAAGSAEDLSLRRITLYNGGNLNSSNLGNAILTTGGVTLATASGMDSKGYLVFNLATPFVITKGNTLNFEVMGDILSGTRANDTIAFRLDQSTDLFATGNTYGYGATVTNNYSTGTTLTVQGGQVTVTFNGPIAANWSPGTNGAELLNFSINTKNNTEFRAMNLNLVVSSSSGGAATPSVGDGTNTYFTNVRVMDTTTGLIVSGPTDAGTSASATSTSFTFTDRFQLMGGTTHNFKVLADITSGAIQQDVRVTLLATSFTTSGNVKNIDNNTNITDIVPTSNIQGNLQHVLSRSLSLSLAGTPVSQTYVRGSQNVDMVGFNFIAGLGGDVKINSITTTGLYAASANSATVLFATGATTSSRVLALRLIDASTGNQIGTTQGVSSTNGTSAFSNLNFTVPAGSTKTVIVRADLTNNGIFGTPGDYHKFDIVATTDVSAVDARGNTVTMSGAAPNGNTATSSGTIITVGDAGSLSVVRAPSDNDSQQGIVIAGTSNTTLAKFRITASNESLKITKSRFTLSTTTAVDAVNSLTLWDGPTQVGGPVTVNSSGVADFNGLSFSIPKDTSKTLTVKGNLNTIAGGGDSGDQIVINYATSSNFEAVGTSPGSSTQLTNYGSTQVGGYTMTLRKTKPTVALLNPGSTLLTTGTVELARLKVSADAAEQLALKHITLTISVANATITADTLSIYDLDQQSTISATTGNLALSNSVASGVGQITMPDQVIPAGGTKNFAIKATVSAIGSTAGSASIQTVLANASDTGVITGTVDTAGATTTQITQISAVDAAFVWADYSVVGHSDGVSADYTNGRDVKDFTNTIVLHN